MFTEHRRAADELLDYIWDSPTPFHAVRSTIAMLEAQGFQRLDESETWTLGPGDRRYTTRNGSSLTAFVAGAVPASEGGFLLAGAHTDSPNLRLKPLPEMRAFGYVQLGVEIYGGVLLGTWTDRDLGLAGRVVVENEDGGAETRLVRIDRSVARVSQLAIHLNREVNTEGLVLNRETHMPPIIGLETEAGSDPGRFLRWLAAEIDVEPDRILSHELMCFDTQRPAFSGLDEEFIHAARIDNLASCHAALRALLDSADHPARATRAIALFDNEEVGSNTLQGAAGSFLDDALDRIVGAQLAGATSHDAPSAAVPPGMTEALLRARSRSFLVSADMAHAVHPNYSERHERQHMPAINRGPVIKVNASARYATDAQSSARFQQLCKAADAPCQQFVMRADVACGSTIGPISSTRLGIHTVDVGNPMLSMHSCREMSGAMDHLWLTRALTQLFQDE